MLFNVEIHDLFNLIHTVITFNKNDGKLIYYVYHNRSENLL